MANVRRYPGNPVVPMPGAGSWYAEQVYDFNVFVDPSNSNQYRIYCSGMASPVATGTQSIGLFTALISNPYSWSEHGGTGSGQVLAYSSGIPWENSTSGIRLGTILYISSTYYCWYTGSNYNSGRNAIGLATSTDGLSWSKSGSNPVLVPSGDETDVEDPCVIYDGSTYWMIYAVRTNTPAVLPGYRLATSTDGTTWSKKSGTGFILGGGGGAFYEWHSIWQAEGVYFLPYEHGTPNNSAAVWTDRIAWCRSLNGPFVDVSYNPILAGSGGSNWDKDHVATPRIYTPASGFPLLFYSGSNDNIPTPSNTNYSDNQWPGGMATLLGLPSLSDIRSLAAPALAQRRCALTIKGSTGSNVLETGTYEVCFGGSGNTEAGLISRLPDDLFNSCQADGGDICFSSDAAGTAQLSCEVVALNTAAKTAEIWVKVSLTASADSTIYVWYQPRSGTLGQPVYSGVWTDYSAVYHLQANGTDSSGFNMTGANTGVTFAAGEVGNAATFSTSNYLQAPVINANTTAGAVSWWFKPTNAYNQSGEIDIFWSQQPSTSPFTPGFSGQKYSDGNFYIGFESTSTDYRLSISASGFWTAAAWQYYTYTWSATGQALYRNGAQITSGSAPVAQDSGTNFNIGTQNLGSGNSNYLQGSMDEFRLGTVNRSLNWHSTDYNIQTNNVTTNPNPLIVVGAPQHIAVADYVFPGTGPPLPGAPWAAQRRSTWATGAVKTTPVNPTQQQMLTLLGCGV